MKKNALVEYKPKTVLESLDPFVLADHGDFHIVKEHEEEVKSSIIAFLDMASVAIKQDTFYNTKEEQKKAISEIHESLFRVNRGLYTLMLMLPGVTDNSIQDGVVNLLSSTTKEEEGSFLTLAEENDALRMLSAKLLDGKVQRLFKMFIMLKNNKVNKSKVRKIILSTILNAEEVGKGKLAWWSVKYRRKLRESLVHAWGQKKSYAIKNVLGKDELTLTDKRLLARELGKHVHKKEDIKMVQECVCFILGGTMEYKEKLFKAYYKAREVLEEGKILPREVLEGIRGKYHPDIDSSRVIQLTEKTMTDTDKMRIQNSAKKGQVNIEFNPMKQNIVDLYVYALENGMTDEIQKALKIKAKKIAESYPVKYEKVAIVIDNSKSMYGTRKQKRRPLAISLAMRDIFKVTAKKSSVKFTNEKPNKSGLAYPKGSTSIASSLVEAFEEEPEAIYVISDGYENSPAGRTHEALSMIRDMGINTPVYQVNPVMSGEKKGIRLLSDEMTPMPVNRPEAIGLSIVRSALEADLKSGIRGLLNLSRPSLAIYKQKKILNG